ncbi:hypothetical protein L9F63_000424, partial [Diploptera punctata]
LLLQYFYLCLSVYDKLILRLPILLSFAVHEQTHLTRIRGMAYEDARTDLHINTQRSRKFYVSLYKSSLTRLLGLRNHTPSPTYPSPFGKFLAAYIICGEDGGQL